MRNSSCIICGQDFEPREGKLYCSDKCKQYAYTSKKNKVETIPKEEETKPDPVPEIKIYYRIDLCEYRNVIGKCEAEGKKWAKDFFNIISYSFFRKNLSGISDIDFIIDYLDNISDVYRDFFYLQTDPNYDIGIEYYEKKIKFLEEEFREFEVLYHSGGVQIYDSKFELENTKEN
jgi:hypothetical protein